MNRSGLSGRGRGRQFVSIIKEEKKGARRGAVARGSEKESQEECLHPLWTACPRGEKAQWGISTH